MKKTFLLLGAAIILIIFGGFIIKEIGYFEISPLLADAIAAFVKY